MKKDILARTGIVISCLGLGISINSCRKYEKGNEDLENNQTKIYEDYRQHLDVPLSFDYQEPIQIDGYLGYQPTGVFCSGHDDLVVGFVNNMNVITVPNEFGQPVQPHEEAQDGVFLPYQHILIVPEDSHSTCTKPQGYDGYEGMLFDHVEDGVLFYFALYTNTETVECTNYTIEDGKIESTEFGVPVEKNKVLEKNSN